ncbi:WD40 repeat domain-containing protein [Streptomyces canus]|uniref:WD40 repeat domain-containing protein n=1 Tax=Streptomyces canus TaxID=58343 RepID=UPI0026A74247|nr:WD40 repeat domain-containing protein [Streptomyces canus]
MSAFAFSPDGRTLATVSGSRGSVTIWNGRTGRLQDSFRAEGEVASLAFSPDARTLAASGAKGVQLWDLATSQNRLTLPTRSPEAVAFSPDGRTLAIGTDGSVGVWSVDLPDPARALHDICAAVDTGLTPQEQSRFLHDQSTETGCQRATP